MEEISAWSRNVESSEVSGSLPRAPIRKTRNEVIRSDLKERKVSKDIARQKRLSKKPFNPCKHRNQTKNEYDDDGS